MNDVMFLETIKCLDGKIYNLEYHQKRYEKTLAFKCGLVNRIYKLEEFIKPPQNGLYRCRLVYTHRGIVDVSYHKYKKRLIESIKLVDGGDIDYSFKYAQRQRIDELFAQRGNCDEILIVKDGYVTDTSIANIALYKRGVWYTPKKVLLEGTMREKLLNEGKIVERKIQARYVKGYEKLALLNAMIEFDIIKTKKPKDIIC